MAKKSKKRQPPQKQQKPGKEQKMYPRPVSDFPGRPGSGRLSGKTALITGGDSGIGKAVAILFAKEGADVLISYLKESDDARETQSIIRDRYHRRCERIRSDLSKEAQCRSLVKKALETYGHIDILVNNAAVHYDHDKLEDITTAHLLSTFQTNFFAVFWVTRELLPHLKPGSCIINSTSVTAYRGSTHLMDYAASKGAIVSFTRSLAGNLVDRKIRVNGVAPGPVWTPLIPSTMKPGRVASHGSQVPMKRAGEPAEIAPSYLFLASEDASYITGQVLHPNGGEIING